MTTLISATTRRQRHSRPAPASIRARPPAKMSKHTLAAEMGPSSRAKTLVCAPARSANTRNPNKLSAACEPLAANPPKSVLTIRSASSLGDRRHSRVPTVFVCARGPQISGECRAASASSAAGWLYKGRRWRPIIDLIRGL